MLLTTVKLEDRPEQWVGQDLDGDRKVIQRINPKFRARASDEMNDCISTTHKLHLKILHETEKVSHSLVIKLRLSLP